MRLSKGLLLEFAQVWSALKLRRKREHESATKACKEQEKVGKASQ